MKNINRQLILKRLLNKSNVIIDDIVYLMMQVYSPNNDKSDATKKENYRSLLIKQLEETEKNNNLH